MESYEVTPNRRSLYKFLVWSLMITIWGLVHLALIDALIGYDPSLINTDIDKATALSNKRVIIQDYFLTIPLLLTFAYVGIYCARILKFRKIPPPGNGFPFHIKCVKYRDHFILGIFGVALCLVFLILGIRHLYVDTKLFGI